MNLEFVNSESFSLIPVVIIVIGIALVGIVKLYRKMQCDKLPKKFERLAMTNLQEARNPNWRLKDFGTNEREIFYLLKLSLRDVKDLAEKGSRKAGDISCIIEKCRNDTTNHS